MGVIILDGDLCNDGDFITGLIGVAVIFGAR